MVVSASWPGKLTANTQKCLYRTTNVGLRGGPATTLHLLCARPTDCWALIPHVTVHLREIVGAALSLMGSCGGADQQDILFHLHYHRNNLGTTSGAAQASELRSAECS